MTVVATIRALPEREQSSAPSMLIRTVRLTIGVGRWLAREINARRNMRQLAELDDYMLRDMGIVRADIEGAVRRGHDAPCAAAGSFGQANPAPSLVPPLERDQFRLNRSRSKSHCVA